MFVRAAVATVPKGKSSVRVSGWKAVGASEVAVATRIQYRPGIGVAATIVDGTAGTVTIYLTKAVSADTKVAFFLFGGPPARSRPVTRLRRAHDGPASSAPSCRPAEGIDAPGAEGAGPSATSGSGAPVATIPPSHRRGRLGPRRTTGRPQGAAPNHRRYGTTRLKDGGLTKVIPLRLKRTTSMPSRPW